MKFLLDLVILIDHFNNIPAATDYLRQNQQDCVISVITRAEVLTGFDVPLATIATQLLEQFPNLEITARVADLAAALRRQEGWSLPNAIQVALAQIHNLKLVTRNSRDFSPERYKFVLIPYSVP